MMERRNFMQKFAALMGCTAVASALPRSGSGEVVAQQNAESEAAQESNQPSMLHGELGACEVCWGKHILEAYVSVGSGRKTEGVTVFLNRPRELLSADWYRQIGRRRGGCLVIKPRVGGWTMPDSSKWLTFFNAIPMDMTHRGPSMGLRFLCKRDKDGNYGALGYDGN